MKKHTVSIWAMNYKVPVEVSCPEGWRIESILSTVDAEQRFSVIQLRLEIVPGEGEFAR